MRSYKSFGDKVQFHTDCIKKKMWMMHPIAEEDVLKNILQLEKLLEIAVCPHCDGSGSIARQDLSGDWDHDQCQWCDERDKAVFNFENNDD